MYKAYICYMRIKTKTLILFEKVAKGELTARQAENRLNGHAHIKKSELNSFERGMRMRCLYGNSGNKFWTHILEKHPVIVGIRRCNSYPGISELAFKDDKTGGVEWFYENDFLVFVKRAKGKRKKISSK